MARGVVRRAGEPVAPLAVGDTIGVERMLDLTLAYNLLGTIKRALTPTFSRLTAPHP
jgi:hypothetical protein